MNTTQDILKEHIEMLLDDPNSAVGAEIKCQKESLRLALQQILPISQTPTTPLPTDQHTEQAPRKYKQDDIAKYVGKWMKDNPNHTGNANQYAKRAVELFTVTANIKQSKAENLAPRIRHFHNPQNSITPFDESEYSNFLKIWGEEK
jgi:hypothetical protein